MALSGNPRAQGVRVTTTPASHEAKTQVELTTTALANLTGVFILIGAVASLFGPLLVTFSHHFAISLPKAGEVLSVYFVGALLGVLPGWWGFKVTSGRRVLTYSLLALAIGLLASGLVHSWLVFLVSIFVLGLGYGALDMGLNVLLSRTAEEVRAHRLSFVNAGYGIGAVIGPLLIVLVRPAHFAGLFVGLFVASLVLTSFNQGVHAPALKAEALQSQIRQNPQRRPILVTFVFAYIFYIAVETSASGWMSSQLQRGGFSATVGSVVTAAFWMGLAIGRSVGGPLHKLFNERRLILGGLALTIIVDLSATSNHVALVSYPILGLLLATMFPMGLLWYTKLLPHDSDGITLIMFLMMAGGILGPGGISLLVSHFGVHVIPYSFAALAGIDLAIFASILRFQPVALD